MRLTLRPATAFAKYLSRWRHGHGFGVHSPWAYRIITEVIGESAKYYAYPEIDALFGKRRKTARQVFRLLLHLQPGKVIIVGDNKWHELVAKVGELHHGNPTVMIVDNPSEYSECSDNSETIIFTCLGTSAGQAVWRKAVAERASGMAIDSHRKIGIISFRHGLPRQTIHARF